MGIGKLFTGRETKLKTKQNKQKPYCAENIFLGGEGNVRSDILEKQDLHIFFIYFSKYNLFQALLSINTKISKFNLFIFF